MKLLIASVFTNTGIAKASGNPYAMTRALALVPFEDIENKNFQSRGYGFNAVEMSVSNAFADELQTKFQTAFKGLPVALALRTSLDRDSRNVIVGWADGKD